MPASRSIGSENQLLFDDTLVKDKRGFVLTLNAPVKAETAALLPDILDPAKAVTSVSPSMENEKVAPSVRLVLVL